MAMAMARAKQPSIPVLFHLVATPLFFLSFFTATSVVYADHAGWKLVKGVCKETPDYSFCIEALGSHPYIHAVKNYLDVAVISLEVAISNSTDAQSYITKMYNSTGTEPGKKPALDRCMYAYVDVVGCFKSALSEVKEDALTANYDAMVAGDSLRICEDALALSPVNDSSISAMNLFTTKYIKIADVATTLLIT